MQTLNISKLSVLNWFWRSLAGVAALLVLVVALLMGNQPAKQVAASSFHQWRTAQVVAAFETASLDVEMVDSGKKGEDDGLSMFMAVEATPFRIPSAGANEGGIILSFYKADDLARMRNYYLALNKSLPQFSSWVFVKDNILLQINGSLPGPKARQYAAALEALESEKTLAIVATRGY
jgi:hypothetical protein